MDIVIERKKNRFVFLKRLYEETNGNILTALSMVELGLELGFSQEDTYQIARYLANEDLLKFQGVGTDEIGITHYGVVQIEEALSAPDVESSYFPPVNIINVEQMINSQIQQGASNSTQTVTFDSGKIAALENLLLEIKANLPDLDLDEVDQSEVNAEIDTIETQLKSSRPKTVIFYECLGTLRRVFEGAAGSTIATTLIHSINAFL